MSWRFPGINSLKSHLPDISPSASTTASQLLSWVVQVVFQLAASKWQICPAIEHKQFGKLILSS
jgi:hypothetical protein